MAPTGTEKSAVQNPLLKYAVEAGWTYHKHPGATWQTLEGAVPVDLLRAEVAAWGRRLEVEPREVRIQPMKRKWAS